MAEIAADVAFGAMMSSAKMTTPQTCGTTASFKDPSLPCEDAVAHLMVASNPDLRKGGSLTGKA